MTTQAEHQAASVAQQLRLVDRVNGLDRFDLDQHTVLDENGEFQRIFSFKSLISDDDGLLIAVGRRTDV
jgi:hypothetical protein